MTKYFVTFYLFLAHCQVYGLGWSEFEKYEDSENISHKPSGIETKYSRRMETKTFSETDGAVIGKAIFQLEKKEEGESFRIVDPNPWIKVTTSGEVQVKKKWDFEALSSEKTIVFDVVSLASSGENGKQKIVLKITDVNDEVPFFINRPLPMQTVVELNATPNTPVFYLRARDLDDDADIHYFLVRDRTGGRFEVDEKSGVVRTRGTEMFQLDMEYVLYVKAEDHNGRNDDNSFQSTAEERLSIVGGKRPPQFYLPKYEKTIPENATIDQNIVTVRAKSFNDREIRYSLKAKGQGAGTFNIGPTSGIVKLTKELDFEDVTQPHIYQFQITATEDYGGLSASVDLTLNVTDVNDNAPKFDRSDYEVSGIDEDISIGSSILKVKAKDVDTGVNAEIVYSVSSDHFRVDNEGIVYNSEILDADDNNAYYEFTVTASDKSEPPQESTATIRIYTKNKNDEKPMFSQQVYTPNVDENAGRNTLVTTVVASDKDGDSVEFGLVGGTSDSGQFVIERMTGVIRFHNGPISLDRDKYELNVTAVDDGTCCPGGSLNRHTSTAVVVVFITDVNDNKPVFNDCPSYHAKMEESAPIGSSVFTVHATDLDKGINGQIRYSVVQQPNKKGINKFTVNQETGEVTTNKVFDREGEDGKFVYVIIKATDNGDPSLEGVCSFAVEITDINDNPPLFERMKYTHSVEKSTEIGAKVFRVSAFDGDAENNGTVVYNLISPTNIVGPVYFEIEPESGWIILRAPLDRDCYVLRVEASDMGDPPLNSSVLVELNVFDQVSRPPMWFQSVYGPYYTPENTRVGQTLVSVFARSLMEDNPTIFYGIVSDSNEQSDKYFYIDERPDDGRIWADIKLKHPFDYETKKSYNLTIFGQYNLTLAATDDVRNDTTTVLIYIIKSKEKSAHVHLKFEQSFYQTSIMEEEDRGLPKFILEAKVIDDEDRKRDIVYFLSGQGIDVENPEDSVFEINKTTGAIYVRKALDRDFPNGRPVWRFLVFAQDVDGDGPVGYADVEVKLMDINDNAPIFPQILYFGNVTENGTNGMYVMTMTAVDYDDPSEGNNAKLEYSIEKNVIHEEFGSPIFDIDSETGVIKTFICCIDREKTSDFSIQVVAEDGGGLRGTGTASIRVRDINDMPPKFTKDEWVIEVDETYGEVLPDQAILTVTVQDDDETNKFHYKVIESSGFGADKFTMVTNNDGTGSLKIVQPLDYEDPMQSSGFKFKIQVNDKGEDNDAEKYHVAYSWVKVELRDINDNKPQFIKPNIEVPVFENAEVGKSLEKFKAEDPDQGGNSKVSYAIDRSSDRRRQFINDDNGVVRIQRNLDREENPRHSVKILAIDDGTPAKTATATLTVIVADINDNAPRFLKDYRPVLPENQSPRKIVEVLATDDDDRSKGNGPPFHFRLDSTASDEIRASFKVEHIPKGANGDGMGLISSLRSFDREYIKEYHVPIIIKDAGTPPITGTSTLTIVIGDENDNKMQSGFKEISVYKSIKDNDDHMPIGRVYVNDLDDWDLPDKLFAWADSSPHPNFSLNKDDGMISMRRGTHEGAYFLRFHVYDRKHTQTEVEANVTVTVKEITEEAIINSGSVRIANISAEDFVRIWDYKSQRVVQSKYSIFKDEIAKLVGTHSDNVDVFSVQTYQSRPPITDVRFAAHGSPYYQPVKLNGLVLQHRAKIESKVGINITMVSIDECLYENKACEGSCTNNLVVSSYPYMVNANKTSFVGVRTQVIPECTCGARNFSREESCRSNPCFNGGRCSASTAGVRCDCPPGFDGPRCQMTTRSFVGNGYAWFTPIKICDNSHISLEFISSRKDGLILYNGPITEPETDGIVVSDFISLELMDGRPRLLIDFGSGTLELKVNTRNHLSDGEWHRIDIFWDTEIVRIDVDHCIKATIYEPEDGNDPIFDSSECQARGVIPPFNEYLNVNSPLQLGGLATKVPDPTLFNWQYVPTQGKSFHGCIRNLIVNSELYDLNNPGDSKGTQSGCPQLEEPCRNINPKCSFNGICDGSVEEPICKCKPGWTGPSCEEKTNPSFFESQSYVKCALSFKPNFFKTEFQLRFRTWQEYGELFRISDQHSREYGILAIKDGHLRFSYNLNSLRTEEHDLWLSSITVNDGQWHAVSVERHGSTAMLMLDGGEGRRFNETTVFAGHMLMDVDKLEGVYFGGKTEYTGIRTFEVYNDFKLGCLDDIRLNGKHLPLPPGLNGTPWGQVTMFRHLRSNCVPHNMCLSVTCPAAYTCKNLWMRYECV